MNGINIYQKPGGWIYEVWYQGRILVIGCCKTLAEAQRAAAMA